MKKFVPAIAQRLSGLSERSWGDGRNRATVVHARCCSDLQLGLIRRKGGEFLCRRWKAWDIAEQPEAEVTCPRCLAILGRLK